MNRLVFIVFLSLIGLFSYGQESISRQVVATAGADTTVNGISVSWTLGELAVETFEATGVTLTQGFQQGFFDITSVGDPISNNFELKIYPNPASEYVWIDLQSDEIRAIRVEIYNMEGKLMYHNEFDFASGPTQIPLQNLNSNQYILKISDSDGKLLQTFKLIKRL